MASAEDLYVGLVQAFGTGPEGRGFGSKALKVEGKIFASLSKGQLLAKLPPERVEALIAAGEASRYESGGRPTKEWVLLPPTDAGQWRALAEEARAYIAKS